jgi:hypothetical protein
MPAFPRPSLTAASLLLTFIALPAVAQEVTTGDAKVPLVYKVENSGSKFPTPTFPAFDKLPIVRPLPDPFVMNDGKRDTTFANWEKRRNQIKAAIEKYEIGPKPDCADCKITASYVPAADANSKGTLTINVSRNGQDAYFSVLGVSPKNAEPGGPGITSSDAADPLDVRFTAPPTALPPPAVPSTSNPNPNPEATFCGERTSAYSALACYPGQRGGEQCKRERHCQRQPWTEESDQSCCSHNAGDHYSSVGSPSRHKEQRRPQDIEKTGQLAEPLSPPDCRKVLHRS